MLPLEAVRERVAASPFHRLIGLELVAITPELVLRLSPDERLEGRPGSGFLHGGVLATLVDAAGSFAVIAQQGASVATVDMLVDYHRPAPLRTLLAQAQITDW